MPQVAVSSSLGMAPDQAAHAPIRLCVVTNTMDVGGAETQLLRLCHAIPPSEVHITVVYYGGHHSLRKEYDRTPSRIVFMDRDVIGRARFVVHLASYLRKERFDVVHCWHGTANQYGGVAASLARCPAVLTGYRDFRAEAWPFRWVDRLVRPFTRFRVVNSYAIREKHSRTSRYPINRIRVLHNGLDPLEFEDLPDPAQMRAQLGFDNARPLVVTVGRLVDVKQQDVFIRAAKLVTDAGVDCQFAMVGDGPERGPLSALARETGMEQRIRFLGERKDAPAVLRCASLSLCTSRSEGLPNVVLESMMVGTPVITTDNGGGPELVANVEQVVPVGDYRAMADRAVQAIRTSGMLQRWAAAGHRRAMDEFTVAAASRRYIGLLHEAMGRSGQATESVCADDAER